jgi:hypothetical protein
MQAEEVFPSWWNDKDWIIVIDVGFDESGTPPKKLLVVSAILGQTSQMRKLAMAWRQDLHESNVEFFHGKEHWNRRSKAYHGLSITKRKELLSRLIGYIHKYIRIGMSAHINTEEYKSLTTSEFRTEWGSAYAFTMQMLFLRIHLQLKSWKAEHETVNILIEDGHANVRQACEIISKDKTVEGPLFKLGTYGCGPKTNNPILQAADLLAYSRCQSLAVGNSKMHSQLINAGAVKFLDLDCDAELIKVMERDMSAELVRRRQLRRKQPPKT